MLLSPMITSLFSFKTQLHKIIRIIYRQKHNIAYIHGVLLTKWLSCVVMATAGILL